VASLWHFEAMGRGKRAGHEGNVRQRGRTWEASVSLGGRRFYVYGRTRAEAVERLRELVERHRLGQLAPPTRMTFAEWAERYLEGCRQRLRPNTLDSYRDALRALLPHLGRVRLQRLTPLHVQAALSALAEAGRGRRFLALAYGALHSCLEQAVRLGLLGSNPCRRVARPPYRRREGSDWSMADMRRFLAVAASDPRPTARMLAFMLLTGLRPGEAIGLKWADLDWEGATLTVRRSLSYTSGGWHEAGPKTRTGERAIALPASALAILQGLERRLPWVFWHERPPLPSKLSALMGELCERAGVPRRPAHYLRHAHASLLAASGLEVKTLQRRLGHSQAAVTLDIYSHALSEMDRRAAEMVDRALG